MTKDTYTGINEAFAKKGIILDKSQHILEGCKRQFELKNMIAEIGNKIWRLNKESLSHSQEIAKIDREREAYFISIGMKKVKSLDKEAKTDI